MDPPAWKGHDFVPVGRQGSQIDDQLVAIVGDVVVGDKNSEYI